MKYSSIFIANLSEIAKPLTQAMSQSKRETEIFEDHAYCDRFVWADDDRRVLVTPFPLDPQFFQDANTLLDFRHVINLYPQKINGSICHTILNEDRQLLQQIISIIKDNPGIKITSYAATTEFLELVTYLQKQGLLIVTPETPTNADQWVSSFVDSKTGFRQTWAQLNGQLPPMPEGAICRQQEELLGWSKHLYHQHQGIVLKINRGLAGEGIIIINQPNLNDDQLEKIIKENSTQLYWSQDMVVVEEYIAPNISVAGGFPSIEFQITQGQTSYLYVCGMRINPQGVFMGMEIGKGAIDGRIEKTLVKYGRKFARHLAELGYQGFFDIDWVYSQDHDYYPLEANLRRTGGTHAYELATRILGDDFDEKFYLISQNKIQAPKLSGLSYQQVKSTLKTLLFPINNKQEGAIITMMNYLTKGWFGYVIIANKKQRAEAIEKNLLANLQ
ncbi:hypothetical protein KJ707_02315 [Patescibacteria group bacterium]|nr:hypothetical protein [Patescibacteria group bacterium]